MTGPEREPSQRPGPPGTPRWVVVLALVALALVALVLALHLTGTGPGGPGSHLGTARPVLPWS